MSETFTGTGAEPVETLRDSILEVIEQENKEALLGLIRDNHPSDVAAALSSFPVEAMVDIFRAILLTDVELCAELLIDLEPGVISGLYPLLTHQEWAWILKHLSDDDVVFLLELFPDEVRDQLVARLSVKDKADVLELMNYPEDSAGRIMTNEFLSIDIEATVADAVDKIRKTEEVDLTNLFYLYVTEQGRLKGAVSLRKLLINRATVRVGEIMKTDISAINVLMDQEEVAEVVRRYDQVTVPVVDDEGRLLGIITVDDVIDVINEESEEDLYMQIGSSDEELLAGDNTRKIVVLRLPWIMASFAGSLMVALIMRYTERDVFGPAAARIFIFVPMICAMGGNVGVQSSTIMARLLSSSQLDWKEARRSAFKEAKVGMSLGLVCGTLIGVIAFFWGGYGMLITVLVAMVCAMTTAATTGTVIPIAMKRLGFDPALATGPFVTSFNDFVATCVYFITAFAFLDYHKL